MPHRFATSFDALRYYSERECVVHRQLGANRAVSGGNTISPIITIAAALMPAAGIFTPRSHSEHSFPWYLGMFFPSF